MHYTFSFSHPASRYIQIEAVAEKNTNESIDVQLPAWRPGRYELGNFAKNVRNFRAYSADGKELKANKITKDCWRVSCKGEKKIILRYDYFSADLNAGSTYLDAAQLYVNPVNCCVYVTGKEKEPCSVKLDVPAGWKVACALKKEGKHILHAPDFDTLADSPFITSPSLKHNSFVLDGVEFHLWFQGPFTPDWPKFISDFFIFISEQMTLFGKFPSEEYHFLCEILPNPFHHGVEHTASTVIAFGPAYKVLHESYNEFLGLCCHELFHAWNIKAIRPAELLPYDFTKENYSRLGYVCEGVTTYYGDYLLLRSGIWSPEEYWPTFESRMQKHFDTHARYFLSVADASFDSWLDGYVAGAPHRKTSIYHEGCLLAFFTDMFIRRNTANAKSLDDVMRRLWNDFALKGKGYTENDYKKIIEEESGADFSYYWNNFFYGTNSYEPVLSEALGVIGCELVFYDNPRWHEHYFGFKVQEQNGATKVSEVYFNSPAEAAGLSPGDEIIAVNGMQVKDDLAQWLKHFQSTEAVFTVLSGGHLKTVTVAKGKETWYSLPRVQRKKEELSKEQRAVYEKWSGKRAG